MVAEVARRKALAAVLEKATVIDTAGNEIDLDDAERRRRGRAGRGTADEGPTTSEGRPTTRVSVRDDPTALPTIAVADSETGRRGPEPPADRDRPGTRVPGRCVRRERPRLAGAQRRPCWRRGGAGACALTANRAGSGDFPRRAGR